VIAGACKTGDQHLSPGSPDWRKCEAFNAQQARTDGPGDNRCLTEVRSAQRRGREPAIVEHGHRHDDGFAVIRPGAKVQADATWSPRPCQRAGNLCPRLAVFVELNAKGRDLRVPQPSPAAAGNPPL